MPSTENPVRIGRAVLTIFARQAAVLAIALVAVGFAALALADVEPPPGPGSTATTLAATAALQDDLLSFDDRVGCRRRIEQVYWRHRLWPTENPGPKPALDELLTDTTIREHVATSLLESAALEIFWSRRLTGEQLQAELNRMVRDTKNPTLLRELFAALDDDPFLAAECLARPALTERLTRNWYARDTRFHGALREQAATALANQSNDATPMIENASVSWNKKTFDAWWKEDGRAIVESKGGVGSVPPPAVGYELRMPVDGGCDENSWTELWSVPSERSRHTAVWTGAEMIVWGGANGGGNENTGGRYDPATDTWTATSTGAGVPEARHSHRAVWTGTEMIVWGGDGFPSGELSTGGRYDPVGDSWTPTSTGLGLPAPRADHTAVWTGTEMIVWGGTVDWQVLTNTGGRYNPATDSWSATSTTLGVPAARIRHTAVWAGTKMIVWGGQDSSVTLDSGGRYDPATNSWTTTSKTDVPGARNRHTAIWTGTEMIVWGGSFHISSIVDNTNTGGKYNPLTDTWTATSTGPFKPTARQYHTAVWTGTQMIVWGGYDGGYRNTGGRYDPAGNTWHPTSTGAGVPTARALHTAVWTGTEMIVWGGPQATNPTTGGRYDPLTDSWVPTSTGAGVPYGRRYPTAVWTGTEMIVWGGIDDDGRVNSGGRYAPATDHWAPTSTGLDVPEVRYLHTAVWSGTEMIVWGGYGGSGRVNSGGRYEPLTDSWVRTSTGLGVPEERNGHTAVWTGTEMIVWGGFRVQSFNTGGRYDPLADSWKATSTDSSVPAARADHTAVWTGTEMIAWGGGDEALMHDTGGAYDPRNDSWTATSTGTGVPVARIDHTAVWTGAEMIVWGGKSISGPSPGSTGGRYDPRTDSWTATSMDADVPTERGEFTAVWTGTEMIVWGGNYNNPVNTGARYDPLTDGWTVTSTDAGVPTARATHAAVWTGNEMIVWGGSDETYTNTGGLYCACPDDSVNLWYPDADGDGHGVESTGIPSCSQPTGYVALPGDCDDTNADTYSGAAEINDGLDNQCPGDDGHGLVDEISGLCGFHEEGDKNEFSWTAQPGATGYEVARSTDARFSADCLVIETVSPVWIDTEPVPAGSCFHYLVRSKQPNTGSWGANSAGVERTPVCP